MYLFSDVEGSLEDHDRSNPGYQVNSKHVEIYNYVWIKTDPHIGKNKLSYVCVCVHEYYFCVHVDFLTWFCVCNVLVIQVMLRLRCQCR